MANHRISLIPEGSGVPVRVDSKDLVMDFNSIRVGPDNLALTQDGTGAGARLSTGTRTLKIPDGTNADEATTKQQVETHVAGEISSLYSTVQGEISAAQTALQTEIDNTESAILTQLSSVETDLQTQIDDTVADLATATTSLTSLINSGDATLQTQIDDLETVVDALLSSTATEEIFVVPVGGTTLFTATTLSWLSAVDVPDISVFRNGQKLTQDTDGLLNKHFRKTSGSTLEFSTLLPEGSEIVVRLEGAGSGGGGGGGGGSPVAIKDEGSTLLASVSSLNFLGDGVQVTNAGGGQANITIPGLGSGFNIVKQYRNLTGTTIPAGTVVSFLNDGSIAPMDVTSASLADFAGITAESIATSLYGRVHKLGNCPGVVSSLGAVPGQDVFIGSTVGSLSLIPPAGPNVTIILLGRAEPPDGVQQASATDLFLNPVVIQEAT